MKIVIFYEKPGCSTNAKQKQTLREAGCIVIERDLLRHDMNVEELYGFLNGRPVAQWFNPNAPKIKSGAVDPSGMSEGAALQMLMMEPILIRRPLLVVGGQKLCGFDRAQVETLLETELKEQPPVSCSQPLEPCAAPNPTKEMR